MYTANGITKEFPLPEKNDGSAVYLVSPGGTATRMKEGDAYTVRDGAVFFSAPPPAGYAVTFESPREKPVCTVLYPDGTTREVDRDPWALLVEARREREEAAAILREAAGTEAARAIQFAEWMKVSKETLLDRTKALEEHAARILPLAAQNAAEAAAEAVTAELAGYAKEGKEAAFALKADAEAAAEKMEKLFAGTGSYYEHARAAQEAAEDAKEGAEAAVLNGADAGARAESAAARVDETLREGLREALDEALRELGAAKDGALRELAGAGREAAVSEAAAKAAAAAAADERRGAEDARERCAELAAASDERLTRLYALWKEVNEASAYLKGLRKKGTEGGGRDAQHELPR